MALVKTTIELPADLIRQLKMRAVTEDRKLKDVAAEALRRGLDAPPVGPVTARVQLPLVLTAHRADPETEMTPERVAQTLAESDLGR